MRRSSKLILEILKEKGKGLKALQIQSETVLAGRTVSLALRDLISAGLVIKKYDLLDMKSPKYYYVPVYERLLIKREILNDRVGGKGG